MRTADCVPLLLADRAARAVAAVHAGWRGVAAGVVGRAVEALTAVGVEPHGLVAAIGPAIGVCCYRVGAEVLRPVAQAAGTGPEAVSRSDDRGFRLDLARAVSFQLERAGVPAAAIHPAPRSRSTLRPD